MKKIISILASLALIASCATKAPIVEPFAVSASSPAVTSVAKETPVTKPVEINTRAMASDISQLELKNTARAAFENPPDQTAAEISKALDLLVRLYYHSRQSVEDYDAVLFAKSDAKADLEAKKDHLADIYAQIEVLRQITFRQETQVQYLFQELFWRRFSPTTSDQTFQNARAVQKNILENYLKRLQTQKSDAFAFQHVYDHLETLYAQVVENSNGQIKNESGNVSVAPADLATAFKFSNIKLQTPYQLKAIHKDLIAMRHFHTQMRRSLSDEEVNVLLLKHAEEIRQRADELKALRKEIARVPQQEAIKQLFPSAGGNGNIVGKVFLPNTWVLTFDDGPHKIHSNEIMTSLEKYDLPATFFWLAENFTDSSLQETIRRAFRDGNVIGNHSWDHRSDFVSIGTDPAAMKIEFDDSQATLAKTITDVVGSNYTPRFYRCPYGSCIHIPVMRQKIADMGLLHTYWMIDSLDWEDKDPDSIVARVKKEMELNERGVILFHDIQPQTATAADMMAKYLTELETQKKARVVSLCQAVDEANGAYKAEYCPGNYFKWLDK